MIEKININPKNFKEYSLLTNPTVPKSYAKSLRTASPSMPLNGLDIVGGAVGITSNVLDNLNSEDSIDNIANSQIQGINSMSSKSGLSQWISDWVPQSAESMGMAGLSGGIQGAVSGAMAGPWGALIGTGFGLASGLLGSAGENAKREMANRRVQEAIKAQNSLLSQKEAQTALANIAAEGGWLNSNGGIYPQGLEVFNTGGPHELNALGGIPQGYDVNGTPNLVEEGETKWKDYIFSKRLTVPKGFSRAFTVGNLDQKTYADASKKLSKEGEERPFDPISKRGRDKMLSRLQEAQETQKAIDSEDEAFNTALEEDGLEGTFFAKGGNIHIAPSHRGTFTREAKKHGKGVQEFAKQVLAHKDDYSTAMVKKANFAKNAAKWHAMGGPLDELVLDINKRSNANFVKRLQDPNRQFIKDWRSDKIATHKLGWASDETGAIVYPYVQQLKGKLYDFTDPKNNNKEWDALESAIKNQDTLRMTPKQAEIFTETYKQYYPNFKSDGGDLGIFAPALANAGLFISDILSSPEKVRLGRIDLGEYRNRRYLPYEPIDQEYIANKYRAQSGAAMRGILDASSGNPASARAAIASNTYNTLNALGDLYLKAFETNRQRKKESLMFDMDQDRQLAALSSQEQQFNLGQDLREYDINARNRAARRNAIRTGINTVANNISETSRYFNNLKTVGNMFPLYSTTGEYTGQFVDIADPEFESFINSFKRKGN